MQRNEGATTFIVRSPETRLAAFLAYASGNRPAGSMFSRGGVASATVDSATSFAGIGGFHVVSNATGFIAFLGDSITRGYNPNEVEDSYAPKLVRLCNAPAWHFANLGKNSARLSYGADPTLDINQIRITSLSPAFTSSKGIVIVYGGTNDGFLDGKSAAQWWTDYKVITAGVRASHPNAKIIGVTPAPRQNDVGFETVRQAVRTLMNGGEANTDYICDFGGNTTMCLNAVSSTNTTYWSDQIHPTNAGHDILAGMLLTQVNLARTALGI